MKRELKLCSLACNPNAPSPTAKMVRVAEGTIQAFGGTFCVSVPTEVDIGCCFRPELVLPFFRKERKKVRYTLNNGKLRIQDGKERVSVGFLPPEELVTLDVLKPPVDCSIDKALLKKCADACNPTHVKIGCQGVNFRYGMIEGTDGRCIVSAIVGTPEELDVNVPVDSIKALLNIPSDITALAYDTQAIKFYHEDGTTLTSKILTESLIESHPFYQGEWKPVDIDAGVAKDVLGIDCEFISLKEGNIEYKIDQTHDSEAVVGVIESVVDPSVQITIRKVYFDRLLKVSTDLRVHDNIKLMAVADDHRALTMGITH